jgi:uncharacterized cupredoxin-like copper-binding protein
MNRLIAIARLGVLGFMAAASLTLSPSLTMTGEAHEGNGMAEDSYAAGEPGDPKTAARTVEITMLDAEGKLRFEPASIEVAQGEQVKFIIHNAGALDHEFVLSTKAENLEHAEMMKKMPNMVHTDPNQLRLAPQATAELLWKFTKAGEFEYACLIPGHHEAGMWGAVIVK